MPRVIARLLISCPDGPGIVAAVSSFLADRGANILSSDQYTTDPEGGRFFMRMEFELAGDDTREALERGFGEIAGALRDGAGGSRSRTSASASRCSSRARSTACSTCCGAGAAASSTATSRS